MILAALRYFALVFGMGFLMGTMRIQVTAPMMGDTNALYLELPVMMVASLILAVQSIDMYKIDGVARAIGMGVIAFILLMAAEAVMAWMLDARGLLGWASAQLRWPEALGFAGQILFALFPPIIVLARQLGRPARR